MTRNLIRCVALVGALFGAALAIPVSAYAQEVDATAEQQMLSRINSMRHVTGLRMLERDPQLDEAARAHSMDMARNQMLDHVSPRTGDPAARVRRVGLEPTVLAENIARERTAVDAYRAFIASDAHRRNLMDERVTRIGLSIVKQGDEVWVTQLLARLSDDASAAAPPAAPTEAPSPAPETPTGAASAAVAAPAPTPPTVGAVPAYVQAAGYWIFNQGRWWYYPPRAPSGYTGPSTAPQSAVPAPAPAAPAVRVRRCTAAPVFGWSPRRRYEQWRCTQGF